MLIEVFTYGSLEWYIYMRNNTIQFGKSFVFTIEQGQAGGELCYSVNIYPLSSLLVYGYTQSLTKDST